MKKKRVASGGLDLERAMVRLRDKMDRVGRLRAKVDQLENMVNTGRDFEAMILSRVRELENNPTHD